MSFSPARNDLYLDQYFPAPEPEPMPESIPGSYDSFDDDFLIEEDLQPVIEGAGGEGAAIGEEFQEEQPIEPSARQKSTMEWLDEHGSELEEKYFDAQDRLSNLLDGAEDLDPEKRKKKLKDVESTLEEIEGELEEYAEELDELKDSDLPSELWEFDPSIDVKEMERELKAIQRDLGNEIKAAKKEAKAEADAEAKAEQKEKDGRELKDQLSDLLGYLNGGKDKLYFTAKVWGDKHIKDYHEDITQYALSILAQMADAAVSGDWTNATASVQALANDKSDNALGLIGFLLSEFAPQTLDKLPSSLLEVMADGVRRGNEPDHAGIYYINQDGKYDTPKDDRRRKDMGHVGFKYLDAAELFETKAEANRAREDAEIEAEGDSGEVPEEEF